MKMEHVYQLVDGIVFKGKLQKQVTLHPIDSVSYDLVEQLVEEQLQHIQNQADVVLVNDSHLQGLKGYMLLNESAASSISKIGDENVDLMFLDLCQLNVSAQDWNVILTANLAISEYYASQGSMLA
ncbi:6-phospho-beta-glucosidase [Vibrio tarriae]|nr:6-phospho-beta-glucosidase [Vibrio cholerae]MVB52105.1 6-phospho-beta-glucosidase [Vibrio cholerae]RBM68904.1 6-phospho-beta-glucosidase [Vibrio tarriae]TXY49395.1 6-phospho-beta-glucosidase [Vibrio cholerae]